MYILMWCLFFFSFLPFHTHFLPFAPPLPPFLVPAIVAPYFQPRGGQANRQLSPELIANLLCRIHRAAQECYDWHVPPSRLPSTSSLQQAQPPSLGMYVSVPKLRLSLGSLGDTTILQGLPGSILLLSFPSTNPMFS